MAKMTPAQKRAALKYQRKLGQISIRLPKQELARYKEAAKKLVCRFVHGCSVQWQARYATTVRGE